MVKASEIVPIAMINSRNEWLEVSGMVYYLKYVMSFQDLEAPIGLVSFFNGDGFLEKLKGYKCNYKTKKMVLEIKSV